MTVYDRKSRMLTKTEEFGSSLLTFLYETMPGRVLLRVLSSKLFSKLANIGNNSPRSLKKARQMIEKFHIDETEFETSKFDSFHTFFVRNLKKSTRPFSPTPHELIAVADSKLYFSAVSHDTVVNLKHARYSVADIVGDENLAREYIDGTCLIFRLTVDDCHRYIFPDTGKVVTSKHIAGVLHTVQPIAHARFKPFAQNDRIVTVLQTDNFGSIVMIEIGALLVGRIINHDKKTFVRGDEKGYFEPGGSTIVLLLKPNIVTIDSDIVKYSQDGIETKIKRGETIGHRA